MTVDQSPQRAGRREWTALAVLILPLLLFDIGSTDQHP